MQIQFDPRDPHACASVLATIAALHGQQFAAMAHALPKADDETPGTLREAFDAAQAFETPAAPPAPPATPKGDADDSDEEPAVPAVPVTAPGDDSDDEAGNAPNASPAASTDASLPTPPVVPSPPAGVEVDKNGLPWDARIHSGPADTRPKNADGTWRAKRGMGDKADFVKQVEAELRQAMAAGTGNAPTPPAPPVAASPEPAPAPAPTAAPAAPAPTPTGAGTVSGPDVATTAPSAVPAPPVAAAQPVEPAAEMTLPALMRKITALQSSGALTVQGTNEIAQSLELTSVRDLVHRPDLLPSFAALLPEQAA